MSKVKFVGTFFIAIGIIAGGYFFAQSVDEINPAPNELRNGNKLGLDSPLQKSGLGIQAFRENNPTYVPADAQGNVTRMVAQSMFLKMRQMDQGGSNPFGMLDTRDPETRAMIEDTIRSVPSALFTTAIDTNDITMTADNTRSAKIRYIDGVRAITRSYFSGASGDRFMLGSTQELIDNVEKDCFGDEPSTKNAALSKAYGELFEAYKKLSVPSSWVAMHKLILGYFKELGAIYEAFGSCKEDPIRAYVGIDRLSNAYAKAADIQRMLDEKAAGLGL